MREGKFITLLAVLLFSLVGWPFLEIRNSFSAGNQSPNMEIPPEQSEAPSSADEVRQQYLNFFEEVYQTMQENYYLPVTQDDYQRFLKMFDEKIFQQLQDSGKSNDFIRWRSAAYLVDYLKSPEDSFSAFFPPEPAKEYEQEVLGKKIDIGIEGNLTASGYLVTHVEPRSDSYKKGLRGQDIIQKVGLVDVLTVTEEEIRDLLMPFEGTTVVLQYVDAKNQVVKTVEILSEEYFKQTVFMVPINVPDVFCFRIERFNQKTSEDMLNYLNYIGRRGRDTSLILDLRNNPGGPPLAAREISSFFLTPGEDFAYFQKRDKPKSLLTVPAIPEQFHYRGPVVILVNEKSGSASELFSGVMQERGRSVLMGVNTAGKVFLKSMFHFSDESMVLLVTARGYYPDGKAFSFDGVQPDKILSTDDEDELLRLAVNYLLYLRTKKD